MPGPDPVLRLEESVVQLLGVCYPVENRMDFATKSSTLTCLTDDKEIKTLG